MLHKQGQLYSIKLSSYAANINLWQWEIFGNSDTVILVFCLNFQIVKVNISSKVAV